MSYNVLRLGEGGETYRKLPFEAQFPKISKSFIWKTNFATFAKPLLTARALFLRLLWDSEHDSKPIKVALFLYFRLSAKVEQLLWPTKSIEKQYFFWILIDS
jgi:hypothetical protein